MAKIPRVPFTPAEIQARAVQLKNDTAALFLIRWALQLEATAARAGDNGNMTGATNKMRRAQAYQAAARRLVLKDRPPSLGVPRWLGEGHRWQQRARLQHEAS